MNITKRAIIIFAVTCISKILDMAIFTPIVLLLSVAETDLSIQHARFAMQVPRDTRIRVDLESSLRQMANVDPRNNATEKKDDSLPCYQVKAF